MYTKVSVMVVCRICTIIMFTSEVINTLQMAWRIRSLCESTTVHIDTHTHMKPMFTLWALNHFTPSLLRNMTGAVYRDCFKAFYQVGPHLLLIKDEAAWPLPIGKCSSVQGHLGNLEFMSLQVDVGHDWIVQSLPSRSCGILLQQALLWQSGQWVEHCRKSSKSWRMWSKDFQIMNINLLVN